MLAKGAGRWSVIIMHTANWGSGVTITNQCESISKAVSQAIQFAIEEGVGRMPGFSDPASPSSGPSRL